MVRPVVLEEGPKAPMVNGVKENGNSISETESANEGMDTVSLFISLMAQVLVEQFSARRVQLAVTQHVGLGGHTTMVDFAEFNWHNT